MASLDDRFSVLAGLLLVAALTGCASTSGSGTGPAPAAPARYTLTAADLQAAGVGSMNVYDAITKIRPEFLRARGTSTMTTIDTPQSGRLGPGTASGTPSGTGSALPVNRSVLRAYLNDALLDSPSDLRNVGAAGVIEIRFVPGPEAGVRYGTNHSAGVIFVRTQ